MADRDLTRRRLGGHVTRQQDPTRQDWAVSLYYSLGLVAAHIVLQCEERRLRDDVSRDHQRCARCRRLADLVVDGQISARRAELLGQVAKNTLSMISARESIALLDPMLTYAGKIA